MAGRGLAGIASLMAVAGVAGFCPCGAEAGVSFRVTFSREVRGEPATGRLVVLLTRAGSTNGEGALPIEGPFWLDPQPLYGIDVKDLAPGATVTVDDHATAFPAPPGRLEPGTYSAQARLLLHRTNSEWRRDAGNLFTDKVVTFTLEPGTDRVVELALDSVTRSPTVPKADGVEVFEVRSEKLSAFRGRDVLLRAGVCFPADYDASKRYPAVYEVPGFGGDHLGAFGARRSRRPAGSPSGDLQRSTFWIVLDPESENGHTLFADSANNGPCGEALVHELIPALEEHFHLLAEPAARLLRGHSSGGWSALWLTVSYPGTFGACWSSSPDPVDFRRFQRSDIYAAPSMYTEADAASPGGVRETPSLRSYGRVTMTVRQENLMEEVLGPRNTSAQQWDSWMAVWGPRAADGHPAALYDPVTGALDAGIAERFRAFDIADLLRKNPGVLGPIFKSRVRLLVGDRDSFYLNEAVSLLKQDVDRLSFLQLPEGSGGYITIVPDKDHGSVMATGEASAFPTQMLTHLKERGAMPR